jgi:hypothetical protein
LRRAITEERRLVLDRKRIANKRACRERVPFFKTALKVVVPTPMPLSGSGSCSPISALSTHLRIPFFQKIFFQKIFARLVILRGCA